MPMQVNLKTFVEPREAFRIVGEELFGKDWQKSWLDDSKAPQQKEILRYLQAALSSGQVTAHWSTFDFRHSADLTSQEADREFFRFDLKNNCVFHHDMNQPVFCKIHSAELLSFLKVQSGPTLPPN